MRVGKRHVRQGLAVGGGQPGGRVGNGVGLIDVHSHVHIALAVIVGGVVGGKVSREGMAARAAHACSAVRPGPGARRVALRVGKRHVRQGLAVGGGHAGGGVGNGVGLVNGVVHAAGGRAHGEGRGIVARFGGRTAHGAPVLGVGNGIGTRESRGVIARAQARRFSVPVIGERAGRRADGDAQALGDIAALAAGGRHGGAVGLIAPGMGVGVGEGEVDGSGLAAPREGRGVGARFGGRIG